jgi:hypothetical protein
LNFADSEKILALYRRFCRYYLGINPQATAEYAQSYKEMYDADEELFKSGYLKDNPINSGMSIWEQIGNKTSKEKA